MLDLFGFSLETKMFIRLYIRPFLLLLGALLFSIIDGDYQENVSKPSSPIAVDQVIDMISLWGSLLLLVLSCLTFLYSSFTYWKWYKGDETEVCHVCGGMITDKDGKYGLYSKCLACGTNRSSRW